MTAHPSGDARPRVPFVVRAVGGVLLTAAVLAYLVVEALVAAAWPAPGYSYRDNYVSDLGVPTCAQQTNRWVCSPLFHTMNLTFFAVGAATLVGLLVLAATLTGVRRWVTVVFAIVNGGGIILVGIAPGSFAEDITNDPVQMLVHSLGALLAIAGTALHALIQGLWWIRSRPVIATVSLAFGALTPILLLGATLSGSSDLGLGRGTFERVGVYAAFAWLLVVAVALVTPVSPQRGRATV